MSGRAAQKTGENENKGDKRKVLKPWEETVIKKKYQSTLISACRVTFKVFQTQDLEYSSLFCLLLMPQGCKIMRTAVAQQQCQAQQQIQQMVSASKMRSHLT